MVSAVVTGGGRGLGLGFVRQLLARPRYSRVIAAARTFNLDDTSSEIGKLVREHGDRLSVVRLQEIGDVESCLACVEQIREAAPHGVNVLINNAGYANQPGPMQSLKFPTVAGAVDYHRTWMVNAYGPLLFSSALLDAGLIRPISDTEHNAPKNGRPPVILNISSGQASLSRAAEIFDGGGARDDLYFHRVYAASKAALSGVTLHMARVLRDEVIVGQIHPGWIKTTMGRTYANLTQDESAAKVIDQLESWRTLQHSGRYTDEEGRTIPW